MSLAPLFHVRFLTPRFPLCHDRSIRGHPFRPQAPETQRGRSIPPFRSFCRHGRPCGRGSGSSGPVCLGGRFGDGGSFPRNGDVGLRHPGGSSLRLKGLPGPRHRHRPGREDRRDRARRGGPGGPLRHRRLRADPPLGVHRWPHPNLRPRSAGAGHGLRRGSPLGHVHLPRVPRTDPGGAGGDGAPHDHDLKAVVHVSTLEQARMALDAGADGLAHLSVDQVPEPAFASEMAQAGIVVIPTLAVLEGMRGDVPGPGAAGPGYPFRSPTGPWSSRGRWPPVSPSPGPAPCGSQVIPRSLPGTSPVPVGSHSGSRARGRDCSCPSSTPPGGTPHRLSTRACGGSNRR